MMAHPGPRANPCLPYIFLVMDLDYRLVFARNSGFILVVWKYFTCPARSVSGLGPVRQWAPVLARLVENRCGRPRPR